MAWQKNGTHDTLSTSGDILSITDLTSKKFNHFLIHTLDIDGLTRGFVEFNNNTNTVYSRRLSEDGVADVTQVSHANWKIDNSGVAEEEFVVVDVFSAGNEEKLGIAHLIRAGVAGAGNAPNRTESVGKFVPSPDADITRIDFENDQAGNYDTDSNLSALGTD